MLWRAGRHRGRSHGPCCRRRRHVLCRGPRRGQRLCLGDALGPAPAAGEPLTLERLLRSAARGVAFTAASAGPAASPGLTASAASPGSGFVHPGLLPSIFGETLLGPARSTLCLCLARADPAWSPQDTTGQCDRAGMACIQVVLAQISRFGGG